MELAGHKCIGFCEWDKYAAASYISMHLVTEEQRQRLAQMPLKQRQKEILKDEYRNGEWYRSDIRSVRADDVPRADCWCFGSPCTDFSIAGKRAGLDGDRSSLVREVFRIIRETREKERPEWLIYENVKGMLSSNRGYDFLAILLEMDELGYDIEWQIFNSKYHSVPQNRERVYTVGHLRSRGRKQIFPLRSSDAEDSVSINIIGHRDGYRRNTQVFDPRGGGRST
jgi:DNA (cytosine-5)-methyltransferase 1